MLPSSRKVALRRRKIPSYLQIAFLWHFPLTCLFFHRKLKWGGDQHSKNISRYHLQPGKTSVNPRSCVSSPLTSPHQVSTLSKSLCQTLTGFLGQMLNVIYRNLFSQEQGLYIPFALSSEKIRNSNEFEICFTHFGLGKRKKRCDAL